MQHAIPPRGRTELQTWNPPGYDYRAVLGSSLFVAGACFLLVYLDPMRYGEFLGTIGVLLSATVGVVPTLIWLTSAPSLPRWHFLTVLLGIAAVWSAANLNDNHEIRTLPTPERHFVDVTTLDEATIEWLHHRQPAQETRSPIPVVLVAAEGGGIRAAYFTAQVLAAIQTRCPAFAHHLLLISGVSGGSLGAAMFAGSLDAKPVADPLVCGEAPFALPSDESGLNVDVDAALSADLLAPLTAAFLFTDSIQRFLPFAIPAWDRARTLEFASERAFQRVTGSSFLEHSIYGYWQPHRDVPLLMLNTTRVATGERVVVSPVLPLNEKFNRLLSLADLASSTDVRIGTAAILSARFTYITPAGTLPLSPRERLVDGGYFENSGAATLTEAIDVVQEAAATANIPIRLIVIRIGNSPSTLASATDRSPSPAKESSASPALGELLSPLRTLINTREARGQLAEAQLRTKVFSIQENGIIADLIEFQIGLSDVQIPLGWQLSESARQELRGQLVPKADCSSRTGFHNGCAVADVVGYLQDALLTTDTVEPAG